jgi:hypothetical protein
MKTYKFIGILGLILFLRCYEKYPAVPNFDTFLSLIL